MKTQWACAKLILFHCRWWHIASDDINRLNQAEVDLGSRLWTSTLEAWRSIRSRSGSSSRRRALRRCRFFDPPHGQHHVGESMELSWHWMANWKELAAFQRRRGDSNSENWTPGRRTFSFFLTLELMLKCGPKRSWFTTNSTGGLWTIEATSANWWLHMIAPCLTGHTVIGRYVSGIYQDGWSRSIFDHCEVEYEVSISWLISISD